MDFPILDLLALGLTNTLDMGLSIYVCNSGQDIILRLLGKNAKMVMYNGIDRSIGEIKESSEEFGKAILKENLKRNQKKSRECSENEIIINNKVKIIFKCYISN